MSQINIPPSLQGRTEVRLVPLDYTRGIVRWAHPDGYFLNAQGQKVAHNYSPAMETMQKMSDRRSGKMYPQDRQTGGKHCHILMALAFYGDRPTDPTNDKVCVCHHLIPDALDYKPANLLCWLTREQHAEADRRQRALRKILPDMHALTYDQHRDLQDPRVTTREAFDVKLQTIKEAYK